MPRSPAPARMLRSIVSPALGLSLGMLATAGAAVVGCGTSSPSIGAAPEGTARIPPPGAVPPDLSTPTATTPIATATTPVATATATAAATATASADAVASSTVPPFGAPSGTTRPPPPGIRPIPHPPGVIVAPPPPGTMPHPGKVAAPGLAPSGAARPLVEVRPTRATRRATDPDRRALRLGLVQGERALV